MKYLGIISLGINELRILNKIKKANILKENTKIIHLLIIMNTLYTILCLIAIVELISNILSPTDSFFHIIYLICLMYFGSGFRMIRKTLYL